MATHILDAEVVDDKGEGDVAGGMAPKGWGVANRGVTVGGKMKDKPVVGDAACLFEARHALSLIHI